MAFIRFLQMKDFEESTLFFFVHALVRYGFRCFECITLYVKSLSVNRR